MGKAPKNYYRWHPPDGQVTWLMSDGRYRTVTSAYVNEICEFSRSVNPMPRWSDDPTYDWAQEAKDRKAAKKDHSR